MRSWIVRKRLSQWPVLSRSALIILVLGMSLLVVSRPLSAAAPTVTLPPTRTPRPTVTPRPTITPRPTRTFTPSKTPTITPTATNTPAPLIGKILFASDRDQVHKPAGADIYVMNADGSNITRLTQTKKVFASEAVWSPDGTQIAYLEGLTSTYIGPRKFIVNVMNADGSNPKDIKHLDYVTILAWSPEASRLALTWDVNSDQGQMELVVMNADGTGFHQLTFNGYLIHALDWSPDGKQIVFATGDPRIGAGRQNLYIINADGTNFKRLTNTPIDQQYPVWSVDGTRILFFSNAAGQNRYDIYSMKPDGSDIKRLSNLNMPDFFSAGVAWSPDRSHVVFTCQNNEKFAKLCVMDVDGNNLTQLTSDPSNDFYPNWSPQ